MLWFFHWCGHTVLPSGNDGLDAVSFPCVCCHWICFAPIGVNACFVTLAVAKVDAWIVKFFTCRFYALTFDFANLSFSWAGFIYAAQFRNPMFGDPGAVSSNMFGFLVGGEHARSGAILTMVCSICRGFFDPCSWPFVLFYLHV